MRKLKSSVYERRGESRHAVVESGEKDYDRNSALLLERPDLRDNRYIESDRSVCVKKWIRKMGRTLRVKTLVKDLLLETTTALLNGTDVQVLRVQVAFKEPSAVFRAKLYHK